MLSELYSRLSYVVGLSCKGWKGSLMGSHVGAIIAFIDNGGISLMCFVMNQAHLRG